jgi:hypothetical protein
MRSMPMGYLVKRCHNIIRMTCVENTSLTNTDLSSIYNGSIHILPSTMWGSGDREGNGMLKSDVVKRHVTSLQTANIIPKTENPETYGQKITAFMGEVQKEYCFYESRYKYALNQLFTQISSSYQSGAASTQVAAYIDYAQKLNTRLNDIIQLLNAITIDMFKINDELQRDIKKFKEEMDKKKAQLEKQNEIINSNQASVKIKKEMVRYTEEKSRHTNRLLQTYSFLNIVALGLLVYVYKSAE